MTGSDTRALSVPGPLALAFGIAAVAGLAALARLASGWSGPVPDVVIGLVAGGLIRNVWGIPASLKPGIRFVLHYVLRAAIVLFGLGLSLAQVAATGRASLALVALCFFIALGLGWAVARLFGLNPRIGTLIGAGTAICGGSAILAIGPLVEAGDDEIAYALGTIFTFNIVALLVFPLLGHALNLGDPAFGSWTGTAVNDTSVVVATGYAYSHAAGGVATIVKLTRTLFLVPLALTIAALAARRANASVSLWDRVRNTIPWFVVLFVLAAALRSTGFVAPGVLLFAGQLAGFLILMVLVAVGLNTDVRALARLGSRPLVAGLILATTMAAISFGLVTALGIH